MKKFGPSFLISLLLHAGLLALFLFSWVRTQKPLVPAAVPVEIVSQIPSREQAEAPVDQHAVLPPSPIPAPEETPTPPQPEPAPPLPVPTPQKAVTPAPKPTPKPTPKPAPPKPAPPDKNGLKKPVPPKPAKPQKPTLDLNALAQLAAAPSKSPTRQQARANTHRTTGASAVGSGPADAGQKQALALLGKRLQDAWLLNCDVPGSRDVNPEISFVLTPNGRALQVTWVNRRSDPVWQAGASLAMAAVNNAAEKSTDLPVSMYGQKITFTFLAEKACEGQ
ncbi:hypothetical protein [Asticcacaulis sp. EMRT-3]|uniref:hypothetical protein n=1 Tax=Asticcacaulis sp. EMRT-3 TaxID=3040349 RepID=UPI0024AFCC88|nr:hypothetical protein [Asticcacaulis sp. EMRT-3]MDI7775283.1 hypothetical protein [Asticcacaulis sp. EMRT-3]